jgi:hypothetical protein
MGQTDDAPILTETVCQTTPARRDDDLLPFDVWTEVTRDVEQTIERVAEQEADR